MLNNPAETAETISACAKIVEGYADEQPELWAVVAALRSCDDWMIEMNETLTSAEHHRHQPNQNK